MTPSPDEWTGQLYDRYGAALYRYAVTVLADSAAAADAVQAVFVGLLRRRTPPEFDERYLRRAVRNERMVLEQALRQLPGEQREVVHLKVFEGMTFQEIADMTDESINTVASRYRYAIEKLRAQLT